MIEYARLNKGHTSFYAWSHNENGHLLKLVIKEI